MDIEFTDTAALTFLLGLYETGRMRFGELDAWLRQHVDPGPRPSPHEPVGSSATIIPPRAHRRMRCSLVSGITEAANALRANEEGVSAQGSQVCIYMAGKELGKTSSSTQAVLFGLFGLFG
jgi:hypothetical protein